MFESPTDLARYRFESLIALEELVPSIAILVLTARGKGRRYPSASPSEIPGFGVRTRNDDHADIFLVLRSGASHCSTVSFHRV